MNSKTTFCFGVGIGTVSSSDDLLEVYFPCLGLTTSTEVVNWISSISSDKGADESFRVSKKILKESLSQIPQEISSHKPQLESLLKSEKPIIGTVVLKDKSPATRGACYLKLQIISHRMARPHEVNLDGLFGVLANVAWTNDGAISLEDLPSRQLEARLNGRVLSVDSVDKFPKMTDYVVPSGVRVADTARVRLGAYLGQGTTIMHEGFVNFNAGTLGTSMVEGRISAGVLVGEGSDIGGGASTMGTLSGGNSVVISIGESCLIGANAGVGIPLGDRCTVEAGLYVTAGLKVEVLDDGGDVAKVVSARELAGESDLLFRRNSRSGAVQCKTNRSAISLNEALHANE